MAAILNEKDALDCTALHYAAKYNHCNIIELLLKLDGIGRSMVCMDVCNNVHYSCQSPMCFAMSKRLWS